MGWYESYVEIPGTSSVKAKYYDIILTKMGLAPFGMNEQQLLLGLYRREK